MAAEFREEGVPLIRLAGLKEGVSVLDGCNYLDPDTVSSRWAHFRTQPDDVLLSTSASLGEVAVVRGSAVGAIPYTGIVRFRPRSGAICPAFIPLMLTAPAFKEQVEAMGVGSVMRHFGPMHLRRMVVTFPDLSTQQAFAEVLGALDDKIATNAKISSLVDDLLAARLTEQLVLNDVSTVPLGGIARVNATSASPGTGQLRYIDIAAVGVGSFQYPDLSDWTHAPSRARRKVAEGDTLWSSVRPNRRSHALNLSDDPLLVASTGLAVLSPRTVGFAYLYEVTKRPKFSAYLETVAEGSAYPAVRQDRFEAAPVPLLAVEERDRFEQAAAPLRRRAHSASAENRLLTQLRDTVLPKLMSGKLRVRDAEKQVEAVV
jgi:type I restriction enzyme S subunit